jgi:4-carboxymuconolactone decarboxylase
MSGARTIDERMEQITGQPQRIAPLREEDMTPETHRFAAELRTAFGIPENGTIPEVMRTMLVHPELFRAQMAIGMVMANSAIPARERELAVLRCGWLCQAPYEWGEHVDIGKRMGLTAEEVERCTVGADAPGWSEHDRAIVKGVEELLSDHMLSDAIWDALAKTWDDRQLMEFPVLVGQYVATALQQNTLRVRLAANNPGLGHR